MIVRVQYLGLSAALLAGLCSQAASANQGQCEDTAAPYLNPFADYDGDGISDVEECQGPGSNFVHYPNAASLNLDFEVPDVGIGPLDPADAWFDVPMAQAAPLYTIIGNHLEYQVEQSLPCGDGTTLDVPSGKQFIELNTNERSAVIVELDIQNFGGDTSSGIVEICFKHRARNGVNENFCSGSEPFEDHVRLALGTYDDDEWYNTANYCFAADQHGWTTQCAYLPVEDQNSLTLALQSQSGPDWYGNLIDDVGIFFCSGVDTDQDGTPDWQDEDSDNDGVPDESDSAPTDECVPNSCNSPDPVEPDTDSVEPVTAPVEPDTDPVEPDTDSVEPDTDPVEPDTDSVEPDTDPVEPDTAPVEPDPTGEPLDSDGDGIPDHIEDRNGNGEFDDGETNPEDPDTDDDLLCDGGKTVIGVCAGGEDLNNDGDLGTDPGETNPLIASDVAADESPECACSSSNRAGSPWGSIPIIAVVFLGARRKRKAVHEA